VIALAKRSVAGVNSQLKVLNLTLNAADLRKIVHSVKQSLTIGINALVRLNLYFYFNSQCKTYFFQNTCIKYLCFAYSCIAKNFTNV
jgi:hypothetical protein